MVISSEHILRLAKTYSDATGTPQVTLSSRVFKDSKKLAAMEAGGDLTTKRAAVALQWFSDKWPEDVEWPKDIERPFEVLGAA